MWDWTYNKRYPQQAMLVILYLPEPKHSQFTRRLTRLLEINLRFLLSQECTCFQRNNAQALKCSFKFNLPFKQLVSLKWFYILQKIKDTIWTQSKMLYVMLIFEKKQKYYYLNRMKYIEGSLMKSSGKIFRGH